MKESFLSSASGGSSILESSQNSMITKLRRENNTLKNSIETYQKTKADTISRQISKHKNEMQRQLQTIKKNIEEQYRQKQAEWQMKKSRRLQTSASQQSSYKSVKDAMFLLDRIGELQTENIQLLNKMKEQKQQDNERYQDLDKKYEQMKMKMSSYDQKESSNSEASLYKAELQKQKQKNKQLAKSKIDLSRKIDSMKQKLKKYQEMQKISKETSHENQKEKISSLQALVQQYEQRIRQANNSMSVLEYMLSEEKQLNRIKTEQNIDLINSIGQLKMEIAKVAEKNNSQRFNYRDITIYFEDLIGFVKFYFNKLENRQSKFKALLILRKQLDSMNL